MFTFEGITSYNIDQIKIGDQGTNGEVSDTTDDDQGTVAGP